MKKRIDKPAAKVTAFCFMIFFTVLLVLGGAGIVFLLGNNAYLDGGKSMYEEIYERQCYDDVGYVHHVLEYSDPPFTIPPTEDFINYYNEVFEDLACQVEVIHEDTVLLSNFQLSGTPLHVVSAEGTVLDAKISVTIRASLDPNRMANTYTRTLVDNLVRWRYWILGAEILFFLLWLYCFIFTLVSAGHWRGHEGIHLTWLAKIPLEVWLFAFLICGIAFDELWRAYEPLVFITPVLLLYFFLPALAAQCKAGTVLKDSLIGRGIRGIRFLLQHISLVWKTTLTVGLLLLFNIFVILNFDHPEAFVVLFMVNVVAGAFIIYLAIGLRKLQRGGQALAAGDYSQPVDTSHLIGDFRRHGENLNAIQQGFQTAVGRQIRAERLKTELITNVSHDIKTPLTSIVNYVDLLKKESLENPAAQEYIDVLDRQSARLKKLTEDLVDASKAASGTMPVALARTDVNVFLTQVLGEYQQRLAESQIEPVLTLDETNPCIQADGKLLWRVLDNLLSNVCKYAMPGTRVYIGSQVSGNTLAITLRNISRYPLNISAEELMERFVRGDASRSTEGSGLGLNIARDLTNLQRGGFQIFVDGDLFKVQLSFLHLPED